MSYKYFWLIIVLSCLLFSSCSRKESELLRVSSPLPTGTINTANPIRLTFSKAIVPPESVSVWTSTPFIRFTPAIAGKFIWQDTVTLVFSPDSMLRGDTKYHAELNTDVLIQYAGMKSFDGEAEFEFSTEAFRLRSAEFFYDRLGEQRLVGIRANLEFTYAVVPSEIQKYIRITINGVPLSGTAVATTTIGKVIPIELGTITQKEENKTITVEFDAKLASPETHTSIKSEEPFTFTLPGIGEVKIFGHNFTTNGKDGRLTFSTSQEIDSSIARQFITIEPKQAFDISGNRNELILTGNFTPGSKFTVLLAKGLKSVLDAELKQDYEAEIIAGNVTPSFKFASSSGTYMLLSGEHKLEIKSINVPELNVRVSQIFRNNLTYFLERGRFYDWGYDYYYNDDEEGSDINVGRTKYRYEVGNFGRFLKGVIIQPKTAPNQEVTTLFDLRPYIPNDYRGFYLVEISPPNETWRSTAKLVSLSNIGMIVKTSTNELVTFLTDIGTTKPIGNATVNLVSTSNQVISSIKSDKDGVARFGNLNDLKKEFQINLVTAQLDTDYNFINLPDNRVEMSRFDIAGKYESDNQYDVLMYGDRNLYRPGETIHITGIIRNIGGSRQTVIPLKLSMISPTGIVLKEVQQTANEEGSFEFTLPTTTTALTGEYSFLLNTLNNIYLSTYSVNVEDFVPDRLKITMKASKDAAIPGESIAYDIEALNFFGPPAAGRNFEFEGSFEAIPYYSKRFRDFDFADISATRFTGNPVVITGTTNAEGKATAKLTVPLEATSSGVVKAKGKVAVFDESGRPVYQIAATTVFPKKYFIGIKNFGDYYVKPQSNQLMKIIAVDNNDAPIEGFKAKVEIIRKEWHSVLRQYQNSGALRYVSEQRELIEHTDVITLGSSPTDYKYSTSRSGDYIIRVSKADEPGYNQFSFYSYSWGTSDVTSFDINPEAKIDIVLNDSSYAPGEKAKVLFKTPFNGTMLVTIERNSVYTYKYIDVVDNAATMEIPVEERFLPNVYISAVLFRKITGESIPLLAGHGVCPLFVEKPSNKLNVAISAPAKIRPKTRQTITVKAGQERNVFVTIAAVDEGILQLKNYATPNPYKYFYARKALQTQTYDFFKDLLPEIKKSKTGGGDAELAQKVNPLGVMRFKPIALWSGIIKTNANGEASVSFDIPEFSGELRLMAVAYKGNRFGSAQKGMKVADPIVLTPSLPRFLSPNDSIAMTVTAFNTTENGAKLNLEIVTEGGITALTKSASLEIGANQERYTLIPLKASNQIGKAVVKIKTKAFGETIESVTELPVRPAAPYISEAISKFVDAGKTITDTVSNAYHTVGRKAYITLSPFPVANFAKELKYIIGYPHGCLEQTTSKAFPQIYLRDIAMILDPSILNKGNPTYFVNEAITKLSSMQRHDGEFNYWPEGGSSYPWATVYATHFLVEAKKAGYAVPEATLKKALQAVGTFARSKKTVDYHSYGPGGKITVRRLADKTAIYALYVLSIAGMPDNALMNFYRTERSLLSTDTRYMLSASFALSGDRRTSIELMPTDFVAEEPEQETGETFDSPIRANAIILNVLLESDINNPKVALYMDYLSKEYKKNTWHSTQENAFTLLAFGKAAKMASATKIQGTIKVGLKEIAYSGGTQKFDIDPFGKKITLSMKGEGRVYYSIVTTGIKTDGKIPVKDNNLQIRREFFRRDGSTADMNRLKQNDLVIVKLTLKSPIANLENIAITDMLPGGFEIENPRLNENTNYSFIQNATTPQYMDIRDDRINIFTYVLNSSPNRYYYMMRAVTPGIFDYPPVTAEAMYNADYYSGFGGMKIKVVR